jgi:uncharacterized membrane protein YecN with MAPEG domain
MSRFDYNERGSVLDRALGWLHHRAVYLVGASLALAILRLFVDYPIAIDIVINAAMSGMLGGTVMHAVDRCPLCEREIALAGPDVAVKRRRMLRVFHWVGNAAARIMTPVYDWTRDRGWSVSATMTAIAVVTLAAVSIPFAVIGILAPGGVKIMTIVILVCGVYLMRARDVHATAVPWCPMCRDDGGDDERDPVSPPPPPGVGSL